MTKNTTHTENLQLFKMAAGQATRKTGSFLGSVLDAFFEMAEEQEAIDHASRQLALIDHDQISDTYRIVDWGFLDRNHPLPAFECFDLGKNRPLWNIADVQAWASAKPSCLRMARS